MGEHEFKVLSVLKKLMTEEQFKAFEDKAAEFETSLNADITKYITTNTPNKEELQLEAKKTAHQEVIKELGISGVENIDQLNAHIATVNSSTTDKDAEVLRLTNELSAKTTEYNTLNKTYGEVNAKVTRNDVASKISNAGFNKAFNDDLTLVALSMINDENDAETVIAKMKTDSHKHYLASGDFSAGLPNEESNNENKIDDETVAKWAEEAGVGTEKTK